MTILSLKPAYIPLIQKPSCCAVTCLQMILFRNGFGLHDQEDLALKFGVKISQKDAYCFRETMPTSENVADWGISTVESEDFINAFLKSVASGLKAKSYKRSSIPSLAEFLKNHLQANHDIWVEYHSDEIHAYDKESKGHIHDNVIDSLDLDKGIVTAIDPWPWHRQRISVSLDVLDRAISNKYGRETGFVVIEQT